MMLKSSGKGQLGVKVNNEADVFVSASETVQGWEDTEKARRLPERSRRLPTSGRLVETLQQLINRDIQPLGYFH